MAASTGTRSRATAAIELVRLEYERERLTQTIGELNHRLDGLTGNLKAVDTRIDQLTNIINPIEVSVRGRSETIKYVGKSGGGR